MSPVRSAAASPRERTSALCWKKSSAYPYAWPPAGEIAVEDEFSLAWRCLDAQYWGLAQRRKRIFLIADIVSVYAPLLLFDDLDEETEATNGNTTL